MFLKKSLFICCLFVCSTFTALANSYPVGDLGDQWEFGSDHLPVGVTVYNRHFASWNILDKRFIHWIDTNEQGLKKSAIMRDNIPVNPGSTLTVREEKIIQQIVHMATHPTYPRSVIALQETNQDVYEELKKRLPPSYIPISHQNTSQGEIVFIDQNIFEVDRCISNVYSNAKNTWMILSLKDKQNGIAYQLIHSHVPGGKKSSVAREELAQHVIQNLAENTIHLILGDQNRAPEYFADDLWRAAVNAGIRLNPFRIARVPYPTHINTRKEACWVDNIFLLNSVYPQLVSSKASEFFDELAQPLEVLSNCRFSK